ncbi:MAG TPA: hypothetical protein PLT35_13235 [Vicinamibacterales bacterium]|nr:hypothetical protein [Vicinamibacterales bacterium]
MPRSDRDDRRPRIVTFLAAVNAAGFATTLLFGGLVSVRRLVPLPGSLTAAADRANAAVTYGFMIGDVLYSAPLLLAAAVGLWRLRSWGWLAAQIVNALWIYSMTVILLRDAYTRLSPGGVLFLPFAVVSIWAIPRLWQCRAMFGVDAGPVWT